MISGAQRKNLSGKSWINFSMTQSDKGPTITTGRNTGSAKTKSLKSKPYYFMRTVSKEYLNGPHLTSLKLMRWAVSNVC